MVGGGSSRPDTMDENKSKPNPWMVHVKRVRGDNPGLSYKEVLKTAKLSYTKKDREDKVKKEHPWLKHLAQIKADEPDWKQRLSYKELLQYAKTTYQKSQ